MEQIEVKRHRLMGLELCDVTLDELERIRQTGSDVGFDFNVALFALGVGLSFLASLLTMTTESRKIYDTFVIVLVVAVALAAVFFMKWYRSKNDFTNLLDRIKARTLVPMGDDQNPMQAAQVATLQPQKPEEVAQFVADSTQVQGE